MSFREPNGAVMTNMKPSQEGRNTGAPSLRGLKGRSATELNGQAARGRGVSSVAGGAGCRKIFLAFGREKCFSLDIPFYRTFPQPRLLLVV